MPTRYSLDGHCLRHVGHVSRFFVIFPLSEAQTYAWGRLCGQQEFPGNIAMLLILRKGTVKNRVGLEALPRAWLVAGADATKIQNHEVIQNGAQHRNLKISGLTIQYHLPTGSRSFRTCGDPWPTKGLSRDRPASGKDSVQQAPRAI